MDNATRGERRASSHVRHVRQARSLEYLCTEMRAWERGAAEARIRKSFRHPASHSNPTVRVHRPKPQEQRDSSSRSSAEI